VGQHHNLLLRQCVHRYVVNLKQELSVDNIARLLEHALDEGITFNKYEEDRPLPMFLNNLKPMFLNNLK